MLGFFVAMFCTFLQSIVVGPRSRYSSRSEEEEPKAGPTMDEIRRARFSVSFAWSCRLLSCASAVHPRTPTTCRARWQPTRSHLDRQGDSRQNGQPLAASCPGEHENGTNIAREVVEPVKMVTVQGWSSMSARILSAFARAAVAALVLATSVVAQSDKPDCVRARRRRATAAAVSGDRQDLVRPGRRDPGNGVGGPAAEAAVGGARGCASRPAAAVQLRQARESARRQHAEIRVHDAGRHDDPRQVQRRIEGWQPRDLFSGRRGETPVGSRVRLRSDLSDHARLPRLPGQPDVGRGATRQTLVPRNIPTGR